MVKPPVSPIDTAPAPEVPRFEQLGMEVVHNGFQVLDGRRSVYPPTAIGLREQSEGFQVAVPVEMAVPVTIGGVRTMGHAVVLRRATEHDPRFGGAAQFMLVGLLPDESGRLVARGGSVPIVGNGVTIVRDPDLQRARAAWAKHGPLSDRLEIGPRGSYPVTASELWGADAHLVDGGEPKECVSVHTRADTIYVQDGTVTGTYTVNRSTEILPGQPQAAPEAAQPTRELLPDSADRHKALAAEPAFMELAQPYYNKIRELKERHKAELDALKAHESTARQYGRQSPDDEWVHIRKFQDALARHERELQPVRDAFEAAVKPYLAAKLGYVQDDGRAAAYEGRTRDQIPDPGFGGIIRLGQISLPENGRIGSWAGDSQILKENQQTGERTTSRQHIVNLAAAMVSGKMVEEHEPVQIVRRPMPRGLQSPFVQYDVQLGFHRLAARRLVEGVDAAYVGETPE